MDLEYIYMTKYDIPLKSGLKIKQYSMDEIQKNIGYTEYENLISSLTREPYEFKFELEDINVDYKTLDSYDMFLILNAGSKIEELIYKLNFVFGCTFEGYKNNNGEKFFKNELGYTLDRESAKEIKKVLCEYMFFKKPRERKPANERAKNLIKKQIKQNRNKKVRYNIYSIMESLVWNKESSYIYENIITLTPRQIYAGYKSIEKIKNFDNTLNGIYSGVIQSKDVDMNSIDWINKI